MPRPVCRPLRRPVLPSEPRDRSGLARAAGSAVLLALLAACAETPSQPMMPVAQEAAQYRAHARSYYAPPGPPDDPWGPYIEEASRKFDVPDAWVRAVIGRESGGQQFARNGTLITSGAGAMGLMQLMAPTYDDLRVQYGLGDDPFEPHDNIMAGTAYIRQMYDIYGAPGFLAAYNTGPGRLDDFLTRNRPLPRETRQYVAIIGPQIAGIWPNSRSQADLLVSAHSGGDVQYASAQTQDETRSVKLAWTRRRDLQQPDDQPVQVAEAPASAGGAAPAYIRDWRSLNGATSGTISGAGSSAGSSAGSGTTSTLAGVDRSSVSAAWASRGIAAAASAPVAMAAAAPSRGGWTLAPTGAQRADALSQDPVEAPVRLASAEMPAAELPAHDAAGDDGTDAPAQTSTQAPAPAPVSAQARTLTRRMPRFQLIRPAMAEPAPLLRDAGRGGARNWSVQVGAFGTQQQASQAAGAAQSRAPSLSGARAEIAGVRQSRGGRVYRARLTGLSRGDAMEACHRLAHGSSNCMVVSPDARS